MYVNPVFVANQIASLTTCASTRNHFHVEQDRHRSTDFVLDDNFLPPFYRMQMEIIGIPNRDAYSFYSKYRASQFVYRDNFNI